MKSKHDNGKTLLAEDVLQAVDVRMRDMSSEFSDKQQLKTMIRTGMNTSCPSAIGG